MRTEFDNELLEIIYVAYVQLYSFDTEWEDPDETIKYSLLAQEANRSNEMIFDGYYAYEED